MYAYIISSISCFEKNALYTTIGTVSKKDSESRPPIFQARLVGKAEKKAEGTGRTAKRREREPLLFPCRKTILVRILERRRR